MGTFPLQSHMPRAKRHATSSVACHKKPGTCASKRLHTSSSRTPAKACATTMAAATAGGGSSSQNRTRFRFKMAVGSKPEAAKATAQFAASVAFNSSARARVASASSLQSRSRKLGAKGSAASARPSEARGQSSAKATASMLSWLPAKPSKPNATACSAKIEGSSGCRLCCATLAAAWAMTHKLWAVILPLKRGNSPKRQSKTPSVTLTVDPPFAPSSETSSLAKPNFEYAWIRFETACSVHVREQSRNCHAKLLNKGSSTMSSRACAFAMTLIAWPSMRGACSRQRSDNALKTVKLRSSTFA
mmetsp:Transcript_5678/g.21503  ORF Transcript_5678/g.21503 Transcript_5678/m.21503 type:complete len:303 (-) Transcript_5678:549-1457(-)